MKYLKNNRYGLFALFLASMYLLTSVLYTKKFALVVLMLLSLGSNAMFLRELYATGGSTQTLLFGSLAFLFTAWLALSRGQDLSPGRRWLRFACYGGWGLVVGLGLWSDLIIVPYVVMSALFLLLFCWPDGRSWAPLCLLLGFVIGVFPIIAYNFLAPPGQNSLSVLLGLFHGSQSPTSHVLVQGITGTLQVSIPTATGIPACPVPAFEIREQCESSEYAMSRSLYSMGGGLPAALDTGYISYFAGSLDIAPALSLPQTNAGYRKA